MYACRTSNPVTPVVASYPNKDCPQHLPTPGARTPLDPPLNITRYPASIEVTRLRLDFLSVHKAIPGPRIQGNETTDGFKPLCRGVITPCSVLHDFFVVVRGVEIPVCSASFPLAERGMGGRVQGNGEGRSGYVVCWKKSVIKVS